MALKDVGEGWQGSGMTTRAYSTFTIGTDRDAVLVEGIHWAFTHAVGPEPVLWLPHAEVLEELPVAQRLVKSGLGLYADRPGRRGQSAPLPHDTTVVVFCQPLTRLVELEPASHSIVLVGAYSAELDPRFSSLSDGTYHRPWIDAFDPVHLSGPEIPARTPLAGSPVMRAALDDFTSTTYGGTTMYDSRDRDMVVSGLQLLHRAGCQLDPDGLLAGALQRGWKGPQALRLRAVAKEIAGGKTKRPRRSYRAGTLDAWMAAATRD